MADSRLREVLDELTGRWRDRGAPAPLGLLAGAWPSPLDRSEEWHRLWQVLRDINALAPGLLTPGERELHGEAQRLVNRALRAVGGGPT
jgi:hypothetical protein